MLYYSPAHEPVNRQPEPRTPDRPKQQKGPDRARSQRRPSQPRSPHSPDRKPASRKPQRHRSAPAGAPLEELRQAVGPLYHPSIGALPN